MSKIYERLGVRTIINATGTMTRLGGTRMLPEVVAAMVEAAGSLVRIDELQAAAGVIIARHTGAEAGYVTNGAS
jgi:L-seryl-tRNA(Ser) seleniumtransferase